MTTKPAYRAAVLIVISILFGACGSTTSEISSQGSPHIENDLDETSEATEVQRGVSFHSPDRPISDSIDESEVAFLATAVRLTVEPFGIKNDKVLATGRRVAWMEVTKPYRGNLQIGSTIPVWYGTELPNDVIVSNDDQNIALAPEKGAEYIVLARPVDLGREQEFVPYTLYAAEEGSGVLQVIGDVTTDRSGVRIPLDDVIALLEE